MFNINKSHLLFLLGFIIGAYLAHFYIKAKRTLSNDQDALTMPVWLPPKTITNTKYDKWFSTNSHVNTRNIHPIDQIRYGMNSSKSIKQESQYLFETINILCVILSHNDKTSQETANAAKHTWAKGCNNVTIIQLQSGNKKNKLPIRKTKENSKWNILCNAIRHIEIRHEKPQWAIFVYEQTFVLMENLRLMLAPLNHMHGYYLGQAESFWNVKYNAAHAGYVLSLGSLRLLQKDFETKLCLEIDNLLFNKEDFTLGKVLGSKKVFPIDTRDEMGYSTFNSYNWQQEFFPGVNYYRNGLYPRKCCSSRVITFKGIERDKFYMYYYMLYQLDVFKTGQLGNKPMKPPQDKDFVWKQFLSENGIFHNVTAAEYYKLWEDTVQNPEMFLQLQENNNYN